MKMTPINPAEFISAKQSESFIRFSKSGPMSLSKGAVILLDIAPKDEVNFAHNEDNQLYIYKGIGFKCRGKSETSVTFNSAAFATKVLKDARLSSDAASFKIANVPEEIDGIKYYAIFTSKAFNSK